MRRKLFLVLVLTLLGSSVLGAPELAENLGHLVLYGHEAHDPEAGTSHVPADPEHGCTGTLHLCGCHTSMHYLLNFGSSPAKIHATAILVPVSIIAHLAEFPHAPDHPPRT